MGDEIYPKMEFTPSPPTHPLSYNLARGSRRSCSNPAFNIKRIQLTSIPPEIIRKSSEGLGFWQEFCPID